MEMLSEETVRERLRQVRDALAKLNREREVLLKMLAADESWLALNSKYRPGLAPEGAASEHAPAPERPLPENRPTMKQALLEVIADAHGVPLHAREIWKRAQELGAVSKADSPLTAVDFALFSLEKKGQIEKVGPRTFRIATKLDSFFNGSMADREPTPEEEVQIR